MTDTKIDKLNKLNKQAKLDQLKEFLATHNTKSDFINVGKPVLGSEQSLKELSKELSDVNGSKISKIKATVENEIESESYKKAKSKVLRLLARREYSVAELKNKLKPDYEEEIINQVITECQSNDWQSDLRSASMFLRNGISLGHGPIKIRYIMQQKGIALSIIANIFDDLDLSLDNADNPENIDGGYFWHKLAKSAALKKFGENINKNNLQVKAKIQRFLYNRGFESDHISYIFKT